MTYITGNKFEANEDYLGILMKSPVVTKCKKYTQIIVENVHLSPLLILLEGRVAIKAGEKIVKILKPGDVFGGQVR